MTKSLAGLLGWLALVFAVAWFGAQFEPGPWYQQLAKPAWTPPNWVFPVAWTLLYILMAVAAWQVWLDHGWKEGRLPLGLFLLQLLCNGLWSWLFFGLQRIGGALLDLTLLWLLLTATVVVFWRCRPLAGWLLVPYWLWVSFAGALNFAIWRLNGG